MPNHPDFDLLELKKAIEEHFKEINWDEVGILADCETILRGHSRLFRSMRFGDDDYPVAVLEVLRLIKRDSPVKIDIVRQYLADTFGVVVGEYVSNLQQGRHIVFSPSVFEVPDVQRDENLISVMMPFDANFNNVIASIRMACADENYTCQRADDVWDESVVVQDVFNLIFRSYAVIADFSDKNANVMYEVGIAHTLGKTVIPIVQNQDDVPFDLQHHRYIKYLNNGEGLRELAGKLKRRLQTIRTLS